MQIFHGLVPLVVLAHFLATTLAAPSASPTSVKSPTSTASVPGRAASPSTSFKNGEEEFWIEAVFLKPPVTDEAGAFIHGHAIHVGRDVEPEYSPVIYNLLNIAIYGDIRALWRLQSGGLYDSGDLYPALWPGGLWGPSGFRPIVLRYRDVFPSNPESDQLIWRVEQVGTDYELKATIGDTHGMCDPFPF